MPRTGSLGIVANPLAGKDVRRLLTWAQSTPMAALGQMVQRVIQAAAAAGIDQVLVMPDPYGIGENAREAVRGVELPVRILEMEITGTPLDTRVAVQAMQAAGVGAILVAGGDGTNRIVATAGTEAPILPVAYGTNNVFPWKIEAAVAGFAGALYARHRYPGCGRRAKQWRIYRHGRPVDVALVDVALCDQQWAGSRALWEPEEIREFFITFAGPGEIGLASLAGTLRPVERHAPHGLRVRLSGAGSEARYTVPTHLLPGYFRPVAVAGWEFVSPGRRFPLTGRGMLGLDGERTIWCDGDGWEIELAEDGPLVLDPHAVLAAFSARQFGTPQA